MRKRFSMFMFTVLLMAAIVMPNGAVADLLQSTTLTCNDGARLNLALDTTLLDALVSAVTAINTFPAGDPALTCDLSPATPTSTDTNPHYDYVVGGGQQSLTTPPFVCPPYSFSVEAHVVEGAPANTASGHFNRTQSPNTLPQPICMFPDTVSQLRVDIDCLTVSGSFANMSGIVSKATGFFATAAGGPLVPGSSRVVIGARDNAPDDGIAYRTTSTTPTKDNCDTWIQVSISSGNISIED